MKAIEVKNLKYSYTGESQTIDDLSFSIEKGDFVCLLGANGSGKSTLAKLLVGLYPIKSGEIFILGEKLDEKSIKKIRSNVGIVFQNPDNQFIASSVEDDIAFGLENRNMQPSYMKEIILKTSREVEMDNYLDKEPTMLSGGQKQRVAIAGVLALYPSILIMDEATSMLDPKGKKDIFNLLKQMKEKNPDLTIICVTHDVNEAMLANRIIVMNKGKIVLNDTPDNVFNNLDLINSVSLKVPFFYELKNKLIEKGLDVKDCKNLDEIKEKLCQLK